MFWRRLACWWAAGGGGLRRRRAEPETIVVDAKATGTPFPHYWEEMFGSGRANLAMRQSYRDDLDRVRKVTDFRYVRFHGIFDDENGVYSEDAQGNPIYNWSYVDQIYDGLLAHEHPAVCGDQLYAEGAGAECSRACVLVQADSGAAGQLCEVGRADYGVREAFGGAVRSG